MFLWRNSDGPRDASRKGNSIMGSCRMIASDRWAEALSLAIPRDVYEEDPRPKEGKQSMGDDTADTWGSSVASPQTTASAVRPSELSPGGSSSSTEWQKSEPGPHGLARGAEAETAASSSHEGVEASRRGASARTAAASDTASATVNAATAAAAPAASSAASATAAYLDSSKKIGSGAASNKAKDEGDSVHSPGEKETANTPPRSRVTCTKFLGEEAFELTGESEKASHRLSEEETPACVPAEEGDDDEGGGAIEEAVSSKPQVKPRTRGRRSIKRPARYEEWLADTSQEGDEQQTVLAVPTPAGRQTQHKRGRGGGVPGSVFAVPRGVRRREEAMETVAAGSEQVSARSSAKGTAGTARKKRLIPWIDISAVEAAVAFGASLPTLNNDRAIAAGVAAAAVAAAAVAASAVEQPHDAGERQETQGWGGDNSFYDGLQEVLRKAREALTRETQRDEQQQAAPMAICAAAASEALRSLGREERVRDAEASSASRDWAQRHAVSRKGLQQQQQQEERSLPASATQCPTLTRDFEEAAERAAKEAAAFVGAGSQGGASAGERSLIGPDIVRKFLLKHGRKPPLPAMRAPPQRAHQQLQMIQEQLLEQHRQHRLRQEHRFHQQQRSRLLAQQGHYSTLSQEKRNEQLQLHLQLAQEQRARQQQRQQELALSEQHEDLERKFAISVAKAQQARLLSLASGSSLETQQRQQQEQPEQEQQQTGPPAAQQQSQQQSQQQLSQRQSRVFQQLQRLALLGNIEALFSEHNGGLGAQDIASASCQKSASAGDRSLSSRKELPER